MKIGARFVLKYIAEKIIEPIIELFNYPLAYLAGRSEKMERVVLCPIIKSYSKHSKYNIIQYIKYKKNIESLPTEWPNNTNQFSYYSIILQGPIKTEDKFTVETVYYYTRCYPGASIIVSTWVGSDTSAKAEVKKLGAFWVESQPPKSPGAGNINMQLTSSLAGVRKAKELGCKFSLKTRTDQRIYANDVLQYFRNLQEAFPSKDPQIVSKRLIYISCRSASFRYLPFFLCDFVTFGEVDELIKLYNIKRDRRPNNFHKKLEKEESLFREEIYNKLEIKSDSSPYELFPDFEKQYYKYMLSEYYTVFNYFNEHIGRLNRGDDLMDAYYTYLKNYAVVADTEKLMIYWPKYTIDTAQGNNEFTTNGKLNFKKWLEIYLHYEPKKDWSMCGVSTTRAGKETI